MEDLISIGTGGVDFVRLIEDINSEKKMYNFLGFLEKNKEKIGTQILGYPVLGSDDLLFTEFSHCSVVNNVMHTPRLHSDVTERLIHRYHITKFPNLIHPSIDMRYVKIGIGNIVYALSDFGSLVEIGDFNIMYGASIAHESIVGDSNCFAHVRIGARCEIGSFNLFGNGSVVSNLVKIRDDNTIGVGSIVMNNVRSGKHLLGYPAIDADGFVNRNIRQSDFCSNVNNFIDLFKEVLDREDSIRLIDEFHNYDEWNSIACLSLISMLNEEYNVQISIDDVKEMKTVEDIYNLIRI